jgi:homoserine dehydrogenase
MFFGRGAGGMPTASAVVSDIAMIAGGITLPQPSLRNVAFIPMDELVSEFYLRFSVIDRPGVLARIANHLGGNDVSISSVYQHGRDEGSRVSIVVMTHEAVEKNLRKAVALIDNLDEVVDGTAVLRVQRFG